MKLNFLFVDSEGNKVQERVCEGGTVPRIGERVVTDGELPESPVGKDGLPVRSWRVFDVSYHLGSEGTVGSANVSAKPDDGLISW